MNSLSLIVIIFGLLFGLVIVNGLSYLEDRRSGKTKNSDGFALFQWPMPLILSGLILLFMASALTESMTLTNVALIGFAGIGCLTFGFLRLTNPYGLFYGEEKKKKNEDL